MIGVIRKALCLLVGLLAGFTATVHAQSSSPSAFDFTWNNQQAGASLSRVRFASGDFIQVATGKLPGRALNDTCEYKRLEVRDGTSGYLKLAGEICDDIVNIDAVYPDAKNAKVALVTANCSGTICNEWSAHYVIFLGQSGIRIAQIGSSFFGPKGRPTQYDFAFDGQRLSRARIRNLYDGSKNALGDLLPSTRTFGPHGEFLDARFKPDLVKFVDEHPDTVLGDPSARARLVKDMKPDRFRAFRDSMSGPGTSKARDGRFLILNACQKSNCPFVFGSVVLDGFTGNLHLMRFVADDGLFDYASATPFNPAIDSAWLDEVDTQGRFQLKVEAGRLRATKTK
jgi:hypothetical protein